MSEMSVFNVGGLAKPVTTFIEKVSNAVGTLWEPHQIRRVAQAQADAALTLAQGDIEVTELQRRAARRFVEEETRKQSNIEAISESVIPYLEPDANPEDMQDDWITNLFDKCRNVSDTDMQGLWARILAGEANRAGSFSRKTVNLLADMDSASARLFTTLCGFEWRINDTLCPVVFDSRDNVYRDRDINLFNLGHVDSLGLIQIGNFSVINQPKARLTSYYGRVVQLTLPKDDGNRLVIGQVMLTPSGRQLSRIIDSSPVAGFFEYVCDKWTRDGHQVLELPSATGT